MRSVKFLSIVAPLLGPFVAPRNAQTPQANIAGSRAFWLEAGQGAKASFGLSATHPDFTPDQQLKRLPLTFCSWGYPFQRYKHGVRRTKACGVSSNPEDGGDVGGLVLGLPAGADFCIVRGNYGVAGGVGPTNAASFGVRQ
jgi:hypothetical protein